MESDEYQAERERRIEMFQRYLEERRTSRLSRGSIRFQNGFFSSSIEQQRRKREHPETLRKLNLFLSKRG